MRDLRTSEDQAGEPPSGRLDLPEPTAGYVASTPKRLQRSAAWTDDVKTMTYIFVVNTQYGPRSYTGHVSSRSPSTITLLLTSPYAVAGRVMTIAVGDVISERLTA